MPYRHLYSCLAYSLSLSLGLGAFCMGWSAADWYVLKSGGQAIGEVRVESRLNAQGGIVTEVQNINRFAREGEPFNLKTLSRFEENETPQRFSYQYHLGGQALIAAEGNVRRTGQDTQLDVTLTHADQTFAGNAPLSQHDFYFPASPQLQKVYQAHYRAKPGTRFRYQTLNLAPQPQVVQNEVTLLGQEKITSESGKPRRVQKFAVHNTADKTASPMYEWRDATGKLFKAVTPHTDMEMVYASQRQVRQALSRSETLDLVLDTQVVTQAIPHPRQTYEAHYRITPLPGRQIDWTQAFPETITQQFQPTGEASRLQSAESQQRVLKVIAREPANAHVTYPVAGDPLYLQDTPFLQIQDPSIEQTAQRIVQGEQRAYFAARKLQQWVHRHITHKTMALGFASARDTLLSREGDCTEHAVLLAALTRSLGIPSRVAVGLIYLPDANSHFGRFVYHMWTEVYVGNASEGNWIPLDATNPEPIPDATHIKMADSPLNSLDDLARLTQHVLGIAGKIRIDVLHALSPGQSVLNIGHAVPPETLSGSVQKTQPDTAAPDEPKPGIVSFDIQAMPRDSIQRYRVNLPPETLSGDSSNHLFTQGVEALSKGLYHDAENRFKQALAQLRHPMAQYRLGEQLVAVDMYHVAQQAFEQARQSDPSLNAPVQSWLQGYFPPSLLPRDDHQRYLHAVSLYQDHQQSAAAAGILSELIEQHPRFTPAYLHLAQNQPASMGIDTLQRAKLQVPGHVQLDALLGDLYTQQRQFAQAQTAYRNALQHVRAQAFPQAETWAQDLTAKLQLVEGQRLLAGNAKSPAGWIATGKGLLLQNRLQDAAQAFQNALHAHPGHPEARRYRFETALRQQDWDFLNRHIDSIAPMGQAHPHAAQLHGTYSMRMRQYPQAIQALEHAIRLEQTANPETYLTLAETYLRLKQQHENGSIKNTTTGAQRLAQAERTLQQGIRRLKDSTERDRLISALIALYLDQHQSGQQAAPWAQQRVQQHPTQAQAHYEQGRVAFYQGKLEAARHHLETARILDPGNALILTSLAHVALEDGREHLAVRYYQDAYTLDPTLYEAASGLHQLVDQLKLSLKKPPLWPPLSADEQDYFRLAFSTLIDDRQRMVQVQLALTQLLNDHPHMDKQPPLSVSLIAQKQQLAQQWNDAYQRDMNVYRQFETMATPQRFSKWRYQVLQLLREDIRRLNLIQELGTRHHSPERFQVLATQLLTLDKHIVNLTNTAQNELNRISNPDERQRITSAFHRQLTKLQTLNQQLSQHIGALVQAPSSDNKPTTPPAVQDQSATPNAPRP